MPLVKSITGIVDNAFLHDILRKGVFGYFKGFS